MINQVYLKVTNRCNIACSHCYVAKDAADMSEAIASQVALRYPDSRIIFHGGEPTLIGKDNLERIIGCFGKNHLSLQTNLVSPESWLIDMVHRHFHSQIGISLDLGRSPHLEGIFNNTTLLSGEGISVSAIFTLTEGLTKDVFKSLVDRFCDAGGRYFKFHCYAPTNCSCRPAALSVVNEIIGYSLGHPQYEFTLPANYPHGSGALRSLWGGTCSSSVRTIEPDGDIYVCPALAGQRNFSLGHISASALLDEVNSEGSLMFLDRTLRFASECDKKCWRFCRGGCLAMAYYSTGSVMGKDPYCPSYRLMFDRLASGGSAAESPEPENILSEEVSI